MHGVQLLKGPNILHPVAPAAEYHAAVGAESGNIHRQHHFYFFNRVRVIGRRGVSVVPPGRPFDVGQFDQGILALIWELSQDPGPVDGVFFAPGVPPLLDPLCGGQARDHRLACQHVWTVQRRDRDCVVKVAFLEERPAEGAGNGGGIADQQKAGVR